MNFFSICTFVAAINKPIPTGIKLIPMKKSVGNTFFGVKMGCQAFKRCCLIALSINYYFSILMKYVINKFFITGILVKYIK